MDRKRLLAAMRREKRKRSKGKFRKDGKYGSAVVRG